MFFHFFYNPTFTYQAGAKTAALGRIPVNISTAEYAYELLLRLNGLYEICASLTDVENADSLCAISTPATSVTRTAR